MQLLLQKQIKQEKEQGLPYMIWILPLHWFSKIVNAAVISVGSSGKAKKLTICVSSLNLFFKDADKICAALVWDKSKTFWKIVDG